MYLFIYLYICLFIYLFIYVTVHLFILFKAILEDGYFLFRSVSKFLKSHSNVYLTQSKQST